MSKLGCRCGHIIRDQTDRIRYKARLLPDCDDEFVFEAIARECDALVDAVVAGDRESWLRRHFLARYPRHLSNGEAFHDFVIRLFIERGRTAYECEACGRLYLQRSGTDNEFVEFVPESGKIENVLESVSRSKAD